MKPQKPKISPRLPKRHQQQDFFIADFSNFIPKDDMASMEHPIFSLATKPDTAIRHYDHKGNTAKITPSVLGIATIHDKDILIYCISKLMKGVNEKIAEAKANGEEEYCPPPKKVRFTAHDLLVNTNKETSGTGYKRLKISLERLAGTRIETNIKTNGQEIIEGFGIIDGYKIVTEDPTTKRMIELEITLSDWLYNSAISQDVKTISNEYFEIRKPIERRIYEIAKKQCGNQNKSSIGLELLLKKSGSKCNKKEFKRKINQIIAHNQLPDYLIAIEENNVVFYNKKPQKKGIIDNSRPFLKAQTIENAKKIIRHTGLDIYALEDDWIKWWKDSGEPKLASPDGAFINFCKKRSGK